MRPSSEQNQVTRKTETKFLKPSSLDTNGKKTLETQSDEDLGGQEQKESKGILKLRKKVEKSKEQCFETQHTQTKSEESYITSVRSSS